MGNNLKSRIQSLKINRRSDRRGKGENYPHDEDSNHNESDADTVNRPRQAAEPTVTFTKSSFSNDDNKNPGSTLRKRN